MKRSPYFAVRTIESLPGATQLSQVRSISPSGQGVLPVAFCPVLLGRDCVRHQVGSWGCVRRMLSQCSWQTPLSGGARAKPRKLEKAVARGGLLRHRAHNTFDDLSKLGRVGW
jgi:hypothetical protein